MRLLLICLAAVVALGLASTANAKRLQSGTFCGVGACRTLPVTAFSMQIFDGHDTQRPRDPVRYYRGRLRYVSGDSTPVIFVPARGLLKLVTPRRSFWQIIPPYPLQRLRGSLAGLRPMGPSRLS